MSDPFDLNAEIPPLDFVFLDTPAELKCDVCGKVTTDWEPEEGGQTWCRECCRKWEQENQAHWEDGTPL